MVLYTWQEAGKRIMRSTAVDDGQQLAFLAQFPSLPTLGIEDKKLWRLVEKMLSKV
jgi:hypothetical protein